MTRLFGRRLKDILGGLLLYQTFLLPPSYLRVFQITKPKSKQSKLTDENQRLVRFIGDNTQFDSLYGIYQTSRSRSAYLTEEKMANFDEKYEAHSKTKDRRLIECIRSAIQIQQKLVNFDKENERLLEKFRAKVANIPF
jgi:hypothetical protein